MKNKMERNLLTVRSRAPLRLGLAGGGTDVSPYSDEFGGCVLNVTINKFASAIITERTDDKIEFSSLDSNKNWTGKSRGNVDLIEGLELLIGVYNRIVKEFRNGEPLALTIYTYTDAPPGSGLGSSSALVVALVQAFKEYLLLPLGEYEVAHLAYEIERNDLRLSGGKQDQYAASFGGLNFMEFHGEHVLINPLKIRSDIKSEFESSIILYFTGVSRESAYIIDEQRKNARNHLPSAIDAMHEVKKEAYRMKEAILKGDFSSFVFSLNSGWSAKKSMASGVSNCSIDNIYDAAMNAGALGGKVSGAGGGGFMFFFVDPVRKLRVQKKLLEFGGDVMSCNFFENGAHAWRVK